MTAFSTLERPRAELAASFAPNLYVQQTPYDTVCSHYAEEVLALVAGQGIVHGT